jgi:hypothetical protein
MLDLEAEQVDEEPLAVIGERCQQLAVGDVGHVVQSVDLGHRSVPLDQRPQAVQVIGLQTAGQLLPLVGLVALALQGRGQHLLRALALDDRDAVAVQHDDVALADRRAAHDDRLADRPRDGLAGAAHAYPARPDRQAQLGQLVAVSHGRVDEHRRGAGHLRLGGEQITDERHRPWLRHRQHEHLARQHLRQRRVDHQVVVLAAEHRPRRPGRPRPRQHLHEVGVDVAAAPAGLVDGRRPEPRQLGAQPIERVPAHSALTTCGVTRWNASACRIAASPDERRAWLPRCSARWA